MINYTMTNIQAIKRILREIILPHWLKISVAILLMVIIASTASFQAYLIKPAVDHTLFNQDNKDLLYQIPILIICVSVVKGISTYYQQVLSSSISYKILNELRIKLFRKFIYSDTELFNNSSSAKMLSNIFNDIGGLMCAINLILTGVFKNLLSAIFLFIVMLNMNYKLTLISLIGFPFAILPIYYVYKKIKKYMKSTQISMESYTILMDDSLKASKVVKSYAAEEYEISRINDILKRLYKLSWKTARTSNVPGPLNETLVGVGIAAVLLYGGGLVVGGDATPGSFFAFFAAMMMAYKPLKSLSGINIQMQMCLVCAKRVFEMLDVETKIIDKPNAKILENVKGNIEFDNVTFNYSGNYDSERNALQNINFKLEAGKSYAFVGHSGGGKSTIMNLLLRFYDPVSGVIKIDGNNISDVTINSLRSNISYVGQDVQLFDDTIFENIKYNNISANEEQVVEAAKLAEAHDFISALPERYNMRVGQNGQKLSGGQRQRISIARAILKNSPILLLDEATSALDPVSEKLVQKAFEKLMQGKTTLTIAHRLSTVLKADKIFVLRNGSIIEHGSHKELLSLNGEYANLYSKQFQE